MCENLTSGVSRLPSTRDEALETARRFVPLANRYASGRNVVTPGCSGVSRLSPAIRHRLILEEEVVRAVLRAHPFDQVEKFIQEIVWRAYWKGWLEMRPQVWDGYLRGLKRHRERAEPKVLARAREVASGNSGVAVMDAFARELLETGYLHNHARMWWASFWIHVERLPWELGADFFFRRLLDGDAASNTLGWRWVAGLQTSGKVYLVRRSNLERYCDDALLADPTGLDRLESPRANVTEEAIDLTPRSLPVAPLDWQPSSSRYGIWIHSDDAAAELGPLGQLAPRSVAGFSCRNAWRRIGLSSNRQNHMLRTLEDSVHRAGRFHTCEATLEDSPSIGEGLAAWASRNRLREVIAYTPFVGAVGVSIPEIERDLAAIGTRLVLFRRSWDDQLTKFAKRGFFPFWKKARPIVESLARPADT